MTFFFVFILHLLFVFTFCLQFIVYMEVLPPVTNERNQCITCCEDIEYFSFGECQHKNVCHVCTLKMRDYYSDYECCLCKKFLDTVLITNDIHVSLDTYQTMKKEPPFKLAKGEIIFHDEIIYQKCVSLLSIKCDECQESFNTLNQLNHHTQSKHGKTYCNICLNNRKVFPYEHIRYKKGDVKKHMQHGDPKHHIKPHPRCLYCEKRFFSDEELLIHCEEKYHKCFLCERENIRFHYFKDYTHLETHFKNKHFLCPEPECLEKKFVVFKDDIEYQAHRVSTHLPKNLTRSETKNAKVIPIDFQVRRSNTNLSDRNDSNQSQSRFNRPLTSFNQQRIVESPTFFPDEQKKRPEKSFNLSDRFKNEPIKHVSHDPSNTNDSRKATFEPEDQALKQKQDILIRRIQSIINDDEQFKHFRHLSAQYRQSLISSSYYMDSYFDFLGDTNETRNLLLGLIDIMPDHGKREELYKQLHERKSFEQGEIEFPSLSNEPLPKESNGPRIHQGVWGVQARQRKGVNPNLEFPPLPTKEPSKKVQKAPPKSNFKAYPNLNITTKKTKKKIEPPPPKKKVEPPPRMTASINNKSKEESPYNGSYSRNGNYSSSGSYSNGGYSGHDTNIYVPEEPNYSSKIEVVTPSTTKSAPKLVKNESLNKDPVLTTSEKKKKPKSVPVKVEKTVWNTEIKVPVKKQTSNPNVPIYVKSKKGRKTTYSQSNF